MSLSVAKILVPVDFSDTSRRALAYGLRLAETLGARVTVLHVTDPPRRGVEGFRSKDDDNESLADYLLRESNRELGDFLASCDTAEGASYERQIVFGRAYDAIVEVAEQGGYDMIVMGTTGGAGLTGLLLGSSAQRVISNAPCPVVAVKNLREGVI